MEDGNPVRPATKTPFGLQPAAIQNKNIKYRLFIVLIASNEHLKSDGQLICKVKKHDCRFP